MPAWRERHRQFGPACRHRRQPARITRRPLRPQLCQHLQHHAIGRFNAREPRAVSRAEHRGRQLDLARRSAPYLAALHADRDVGYDHFEGDEREQIARFAEVFDAQDCDGDGGRIGRVVHATERRSDPERSQARIAARQLGPSCGIWCR